MGIKLTEVEIEHILSLLEDAQREGSYYGPKQQYWARHARIMKKLLEALNAA